MVAVRRPARRRAGTESASLEADPFEPLAVLMPRISSAQGGSGFPCIRKGRDRKRTRARIDVSGANAEMALPTGNSG